MIQPSVKRWLGSAIAMILVISCSAPAPTAAPTEAPSSTPAAPAAPAASPAATTPSSGILQRIRERGTLRVGMNAAYKPFEYVENGQIVGYDPDIIAIIAEKIGVQPEMIDTNWAGVIASLYADKFDVIISAMTATPERAEKVLFTQPYGDLTFAFMTAANRDDLKTARDFEGKVIAAEGGGAGQTGIERWEQEGHKFKEVLYFSNPNEAYLAVVTGRAEAVVDGTPGILYFMKNNPGYKMVEGFGPQQDMIIAVRQGDEELCRFIDGVLTEMKQTGKLVEIQRKWLGFEMNSRNTPPPYARHC